MNSAVHFTLDSLENPRVTTWLFVSKRRHCRDYTQDHSLPATLGTTKLLSMMALQCYDKRKPFNEAFATINRACADTCLGSIIDINGIDIADLLNVPTARQTQDMGPTCTTALQLRSFSVSLKISRRSP